jgi:hypothetical protein
VAVTDSTNNEAAILGRLFESRSETLPPEIAQVLLDLDFSPEDRERMDVLAATARECTLTADEENEIEAYRRCGSLLSILKSKVRKTARSRLNGRKSC